MKIVPVKTVQDALDYLEKIEMNQLKKIVKAYSVSSNKNSYAKQLLLFCLDLFTADASLQA